MNKFEELQRDHETLLNRLEDEAGAEAQLEAIQAYIDRVKTEAAEVSAPRQRG